MKINEISERIGISRKAIFYYEQVGLIVALRDRNNYRDFEECEVEKIELIYKLRLWGIPVQVIKEYLQTGDNAILEEHVRGEKTKISEQLERFKEFDIKQIYNSQILTIDATRYIRENIPGSFGRFFRSAL